MAGRLRPPPSEGCDSPIVIGSSSDDDAGSSRLAPAQRRAGRGGGGAGGGAASAVARWAALHAPPRPALALLASQGESGGVNGHAEGDSGIVGGVAAAPPPTNPPSREPWPVAHAPRSLTDLVVHKKKVEAVQDWLARQLGAATGGRLLLVSGPPGCGKATTLALAAAAAGMAIVEWDAPLPTLWDEHKYLEATAGGGGEGYESKLDAFDRFVAGSRLGALALGPAGGGGGGPEAAVPAPQPAEPSRCLILIRDLPHAASPAARTRLAAALAALARGRSPAVLITTHAADRGRGDDARGADAAVGYHGGLHKELMDAAVEAGAERVAFNPVTAASTVRALLAAADAAHAPLGRDRAAAIAEAAAGDLRSALVAAELTTAGEGVAEVGGNRADNARTKRRRAPAAAPTRPPAAAAAAAALASRDVGLDAMHALGKILHAKRAWPEGQGGERVDSGGGGDGYGARGSPAALPSRSRRAARASPTPAPPLPDDVPLSPSLRRPPPLANAEEVAARSGLDARDAAAFLFENLPLFTSGPAALGDAEAAASYLAAADALCQPRLGPLGDTLAASVAVRGVLWARAHARPPGWASLRAPLSGAVARAAAANAARLGDCGAARAGGGQAATLTLPYLRVLARCAPAAYSPLLPPTWHRLWAGKVYEDVLRTPTGPGGGGEGGGGPTCHVPESVGDEDPVEDASDG